MTKRNLSTTVVLVLLLSIISPQICFPRGSMFLNFQKLLFHYSENTNSYYLVAASIDDTTQCGTFNTGNVHMIVERPDGTRFTIENKNLKILCSGKVDDHPKKSPIFFRFNVIIDNSGAVDTMCLKFMHDELVRFIRALPPIFEAEVIKFSDDIQVKSGFTRDKQKLIKHINAPALRGSSALYDAIDVGIQGLKKCEDDIPFHFTIVFTAGKDTGSKMSLGDFNRKVAPQVIEDFIPHFIFLTSDDFGSTPLLDAIESGMSINLNKFYSEVKERIDNFSKSLLENGNTYITKNAHDIRKPSMVKQLHCRDFKRILDIFLLTVKDIYIFRIPAVADLNAITTIYLVKELRPGKYETIQDFIVEWESEKFIPSSQHKAFVTNLTFMDGYTHSTMVQTELAALINEAVVKGMNMWKNINSDLEINAPRHEIPDTDSNVNNLVNIIFDPNLTPEDKADKIIQEMMAPNQVDVIVSGQYIDDARNPLITVRPFIVVKAQKKVVTKNLLFKKNELECRDPISKRTILCKGAYDEIAQAVKELLEQI